MIKTVLLLLLIALVVAHVEGRLTLKQDSLRLAQETLKMVAAMPAESPWHALLGSAGPFLLLAPWETPEDATQQTLALAQLVIRIEPRPMSAAGQDMCTMVARAAYETMIIRAMLANETKARKPAIRTRVGLIEETCRTILPYPANHFSANEEQHFRTARDTVYGLGSMY
jgi:hypothetical protein